MSISVDRRAAVAALQTLVLAGQRHAGASSVRNGIAPSDGRALAVLATEPGLPQWELARRLGITSGGVTYLVDRLEAAGLARRQPDPHHRRRFQISLGGAGEAMASAGAEQLDQALASVPDDRLAVFVEVALLIARALDEQSGELERGSGEAGPDEDDPDGPGPDGRVPEPGSD